MEQLVHHALERRRSIRQAELHDQELKLPVACAERRLPLIALLNAHIVVIPAHIQSSENLSSLKTIQQFLSQRQRIGILLGHRIQSTVVNNQTYTPILLLNKEDTSTKWSRGRSNIALLQVLVDKLLQCLQLVS